MEHLAVPNNEFQDPDQAWRIAVSHDFIYGSRPPDMMGQCDDLWLIQNGCPNCPISGISLVAVDQAGWLRWALLQTSDIDGSRAVTVCHPAGRLSSYYTPAQLQEFSNQFEQFRYQDWLDLSNTSARLLTKHRANGGCAGCRTDQ